MLSLKYSNVKSLNPRKLNSLPGEILDLILGFVYASGGYQTGSVVAASLTCHQLRSSSNPILFKNLILFADNKGLRIRSHTVLRGLLACPHLLRCVRGLCLLTPLLEDGRRPSDVEAYHQSSRSLIKHASRQMTGLRQLRLDNVSSLTVYMLQCIKDQPDVRVTFDFHHARHDSWTRACIDDCHTLSTACNWPIDIAFPAANFHYTRKAMLEFALNAQNIVALNCYQASHFVSYMVDAGNVIHNLTELCVSNLNASLLSRFAASALVPWSNLKKLQLEGDRQVGTLLSCVVDQLSNITHLRLRPCRTTVFHKQCPSSMNFEAGEDRPSFTRLPSLRHLELFNICNHLSLEQIIPLQLQSLRIQLPEYAARLVGLDSIRPCSQVRWLAQNVPGLERLELHIGDLENLWHPTAIPGVDVDVEVYQCLQALASFRNLRQLRLFPNYVPKTARHNFLNARQPLSDEQATRVYRHLKSQCPSLQMLSIAATFETLWDFSPMAWTVRSHGDKAILTTRQARKNYEIEQIWIGERRESMSTRRHTHSKPYLPDLESWTYSLSNMPQRLHLLRTANDPEEGVDDDDADISLDEDTENDVGNHD